MQIVITDGYTLNPGYQRWEVFDHLGEVVYYDRTAISETVERCRNATVVITNKTPITIELINAAPILKLIAVTVSGYNIIDIATVKKKACLFVTFLIMVRILLLNMPLLCYSKLPIMLAPKRHPCKPAIGSALLACAIPNTR